MRSTQKDRWTVRYVDTAAARHDPKNATLFVETRPSPREPHPGTIVAFAAARQRGQMCEGLVLRSHMNLQTSVHTIYVQRFDGAEAEGVASAMLRSMTLEEVWRVLIRLCVGSPSFAAEACLQVLNERPRDLEGVRQGPRTETIGESIDRRAAARKAGA